MPYANMSDFNAASMQELEQLLKSLVTEKAPIPVDAEYLPPGRRGFGAAEGGDAEQLEPQEALKRVRDEYDALQAQALRIVNMYAKAGAVPERVCAAHNAAVRVWTKLATVVLVPLLKSNWQLTQTVKDIKGNTTKTVKLELLTPGDAVLNLHQPTMFAGGGCRTETPAPASTQGFGAGSNGASLFSTAALAAPLPPWAKAVAVSATIILSIVAVGLAIKIAWPKDIIAEAQAQKGVANILLDCMDQARSKGLNYDQQLQICHPGFKPDSGANTGWWILGLIGAGLVAGYFLFRYLSPAERARQERIRSAGMTARELEEEAKRIRRSARQPVYAPVQTRYRRGEPISVEDATTRSRSSVPDLEADAGLNGPSIRFRGCTCF